MRYRTKPVRGGFKAAFTLMAALVLTLVGTAPASASESAPESATEPTWVLEDIGQKICLKPNYGWPRTYVFAPVTGTWSSTITTGVRNFPPGSTDNGGSTFPPGSHDGSYINGFVGVSIGAMPEGDYYGEIWASDGTVTQAVPVLLRYSHQTNCWA